MPRVELPRARFALSLILAANLAGCVMPPWEERYWADGGSGDDDTPDDDDAPPNDLSDFDGVEFLNLEWSPGALADGHFNCREAWRASGSESTVDDLNLCAVCDHIWTLTLEHAPFLSDSGCLGQDTSVAPPDSYRRRVGLRFTSDSEFVMYRTSFTPSAPLGTDENDPLVRVGVGAFKGEDWTFSGSDVDRTPTPRDYSFFFSGEGGF